MGSLDVLPEVIATVSGQAKVIVDGGFCRGTDIAKALALGADCVALGRLTGLALAAGGEPGTIDTQSVQPKRQNTKRALCCIMLYTVVVR